MMMLIAIFLACGGGEGGDDTAPPGGSPAGTVPVSTFVYSPDTRCWAHETLDMDSQYWWKYADGAPFDCGDLEIVIALGDGRCVYLSQYCESDPAAWDDPAVSDDPSASAGCQAALAAAQEAGGLPACL